MLTKIDKSSCVYVLKFQNVKNIETLEPQFPMIKPPNIKRIKTQFTLNWVTPTNDK
jgi:hypothetical protein